MKYLSILLCTFGLPLLLQAQTLQLTKQDLPADVSYRGLHVLTDSLIWASGPKGTIIRSQDGGAHWEQLPSPPADTLDYRTLWAFDANTAVIASAGQPAIVYRTEDAGQNWQPVYTDKSGQAFFDALAFWDDEKGLLMSDPVAGGFLILKTSDGGRSWKPIDVANLPDAQEGEAGFAASNAGMQLLEDGKALFGTGGSQARVFYSDDEGESWQAMETPMEAGSSARGIYALSLSPEGMGVAVGGDYTEVQADQNHLLLTSDGGKSWQRQDKSGLRGYRSGVAWLPGTKATFLAVGTSGMDISTDAGQSWQPLSDESLNAIRFAPSGKVGWAIGPKGVLLKVSRE